MVIPVTKQDNKQANQQLNSQKDAAILANALPYMQRYKGKTIVIKFGGHAMVNQGLANAFARDIALLKQAKLNPIIVHGGGPQIGQRLEQMNIKSQFANGLRISDKKTVEIVEMVLAGSINKQIVALINAQGERAIGLCGKDGNMVFAKKSQKQIIDENSNIEKIIDLGFVGEPDEIDCSVINMLASSEMIPVIAPVAPGRDGHTYNINADIFAGAIAGALEAERMLFLTDVDGVLDKNNKLIPKLNADEAKQLIENGTISAGMIPKVETCLKALKDGVKGVVIMNGKIEHAILIELFTEYGAGTLIVE